jgi:hypothetical protein
MSDKKLSGALYNHDTKLIKSTPYQELLTHFEGIEKRLYSTGVTFCMLWREYLDKHPDGYSNNEYSFYP